MNKIIRIISVLTLTAFTLHIIWENVQAPLYLRYESFTQHLGVCFLATFGDIAITLFVYVIIALLKNNIYWIKELNKKDILVLTILAFYIAVQIEQQALLFDLWDYNNFMPIIPYFGVGLTPILQMIFLLPMSMYLTKKIVVMKETVKY